MAKNIDLITFYIDVCVFGNLYHLGTKSPNEYKGTTVSFVIIFFLRAHGMCNYTILGLEENFSPMAREIALTYSHGYLMTCCFK